jgi:hypothetical protein
MGRYLEIARKALAEIEPEGSPDVTTTSPVDDVLVNVSEMLDESIDAVKVWSDLLEAPIWLVADDLPAMDWPKDAPVYRISEVRILTDVGRHTLVWVHPVREIFRARLIEGHRRA